MLLCPKNGKRCVYYVQGYRKSDIYVINFNKRSFLCKMGGNREKSLKV
jgi:hypothetical protein